MTVTHPQFDSIRATLNAVRKELLDLGLRNPLLNYRLLKSRGLEVANERPSDIYRLLVAEGRRYACVERRSIMCFGAVTCGFFCRPNAIA